MSAESAALKESALEETSHSETPWRTAGATARQRQAAVPQSPPVRPGAGIQPPLRRVRREPSWNVLAEELLSFPQPSRHAALEESRSATPGAEGDAARARNYGEAWLERELLAIRYLADSGYPAPSRRPATDGSSALTITNPLDEFHVVPRRSRSAPRPHRDDVAVERRAGDAAVMAPPLRHAGAIHLRGLRRLLPGVATLAALAGVWAGAGVLSTAHARPLAVLPGSVKAPGGYVYVVRPGDTLWSIATRLDPSGDPRALVAQLEAEVHGDTLVPGSRITVP